MRRTVAAVDDEERFQALVLSPPFLTDGALAVTYPRLNPLRVGVTIAVGDAAPVADTVTARLRAVLSLAAVSVPSPGGAGGPVPPGANAASGDSCAPLTNARANAEALMSRLSVTRNSVTVAALVASWRRTIDEAFSAGRDGPAAISAAVTLIEAFLAQLATRLVESDRIVTRMESELATAARAEPCATSARAVYEVLNLANPRARLAQMAAVRSAVMSLQEALVRDFINPGAVRWQGAEYRLIREVRPARESP